jgi:asparagine synthase (glutamine-hydrolysing)
VSPKINPSALYTYLRYGITDHSEATLWNEIQHLPSAHYLEIKLDDPSPTICPKRYWDIDTQTRRVLSAPDAADQLRALFLENVRLHLRSDVPVGAALSGGIDSSAIVLAMRRHQAGQEIHTFSYVADDKNLNEDQWMELVNRDARTIQHKTRIDPADLVADLDDFIYSLDEPFSSTSMYAQFRVFRLAQQAGIKVMLDGQGADESLGGYNYFFSARLVSMLRNQRWLEAIAFVRNNWSRPYFGGPKLIYRAGAWLVPERFHGAARNLIGEDFMPEWLNGDWFERQGVEPTPVYSWDQGKEPFRKLLYQSVMETSLPMLLRYEDRNSMAHSVESRVPFLTPELINFIFSLPEEHIVDLEGNTKSVFRKAMHGLVPDPILQRRDKIGFSTPEKHWLKDLSPWVDQVLNKSTTQFVPALKMDKVREEWRNISADKRPFNFRIWRWINLICWSERHSIEY